MRESEGDWRRNAHDDAPPYARRYEVLSHTADTGIEAEATTLEELIEALAYGMFDLVFDLEGVEPDHQVAVEVESASLEDLVVDTLSELLLRAEAGDLALSAFAVTRIGELSVAVVADGVGSFGAELRGPPIKAVTYHDLAVRPTDRGWYGRVVFDV